MNFPALATYYALVADEFLRAYFILGVGNVRQHARYFIMAHCLEVAFKASWQIGLSRPITEPTALSTWMNILSRT